MGTGNGEDLMMKSRIPAALLVFWLMLSACIAPARGGEPTLTPYPDTPAPAQLDAAMVESPALVDIHFLNELDGWGVTETQIVRTNDGGLTWYDLTPPGIGETGYSVRSFALDVNHCWVQIPDFNNFPNSGFLHNTSDGGITWTKFETPFSGGDLTFLDANNGWMLADLGVGAGSNAVAVYQTSDGGATWSRKFTNDPNLHNAGDSLPLGGLKSGLGMLNMRTAWVYGVVYSSGTIYLHRTDDGGITWAPVRSLSLPKGAEDSELGIDPGQMQFVSATVGFMALRMSGVVTETALYVTTDAGNTWSLTPTLIRGGGSADFLSATEVVIYNGDQFYATRDAARTWSIIPPDVAFSETFAMMDFVSALTGWVITVDLSTNHRTLYRTSDGGATWLPVVP